jgi:hypothetical protein
MADPVVCQRCGRTEQEAPLGWSLEVIGGLRRWLCESCVRAHVRDIEGKLDDTWW